MTKPLGAFEPLRGEARSDADPGSGFPFVPNAEPPGSRDRADRSRVALAVLSLNALASLTFPRGPRRRRERRADRAELGLLVTAILSSGVVINLGDDPGWFRSPLIVLAASLFAGAVPLYARHLRRRPATIVDFAVFRDRSFATAAALTFGTAFFSTGQFEADLLGGPLAVTPEVLSLRSSLGAAALLAGVVLGGRLRHRRPSCWSPARWPCRSSASTPSRATASP